MSRLIFLLLLVATPLAAQTGYNDIVWRALDEVWNPKSNKSVEQRLTDAHTLLAEAVKLDGSRWEAWFWRGFLMCDRAREIRRKAKAAIVRDRAQGAPPELLQQHRRVGDEFIDRSVQLARMDFGKMELALRRKGSLAVEEVLMADGCLKYARAEYEKAHKGARGCIGDFKELYSRGIERDLAKRIICYSYVDLAAAGVDAEEYLKAQDYWERALEWAPTPEIQNQIYGNMAGTYEVDNQYDKAEEILHEQIERAPGRAETWKNLGLVLGLRARLREALAAYEKVREISYKRHGSAILAVRQGNAWLRAATIHGILLPEDGDMRTAWRLFLEYRAIHGDDYNFSLAFADFAYEYEQYKLARIYYEHARKLQPFCIHAYQRLLEIAPRLPGTPEEREKRIEAAQEQFNRANDNYIARDLTMHMRRICRGMDETMAGRQASGDGTRLEPDPLEGSGPEEPMAWVEEIAAERRPFAPYDPGRDGGKLGALLGHRAEAGATPMAKAEEQGLKLWIVAGGATLLAAVFGAGFLLRRRAAA